MRTTRLEHAFVDHFPDPLAPGTVYVSIPFASSAHLCGCGCGHEVITPLGPTDWKLTFDGVSVSLSPSVGNWALPCRSHYWIQNNRVRWARPTPRKYAARTDAAGDRAAAGSPGHAEAEQRAAHGRAPDESAWRRLTGRLLRSRTGRPGK